MRTYRTPGVFVEEISLLPPSVAEVKSAVPAFVGYTKYGKGNIERITTMLEYEAIFGGPPTSKLTVSEVVNPVSGGLPSMLTVIPTSEISQATSAAAVNPSPSVSATSADAVDPSPSVSATKHFPPFLLYYSLRHYFMNGGGPCWIVSIGSYDDSPNKDHFRTGLNALAQHDEPTILVCPDATLLETENFASVCQDVLAHCATLMDRFAVLDVLDGDINKFRDKIGTKNLSYGAAYHPYLKTVLTPVYDDADIKVIPLNDKGEPGETLDLDKVKTTKTDLYARVKKALEQERITLPPSAAIAGIYCSVDRDRGVWKAPANVSLNGVIAPVKFITDEDQEGLNIDVNAGKSINAIRAFTGKGVLVWGARTLAGNDNEWRYVPVRRLFIMVEESTKKASAFAVFEPNDAGTWLKVKGMIESYLYSIWERGALAGSKPDQAYIVNIGLGRTMTPQDILEGRMIIEIRLAAVRPAEFIVLRFMHRLQQA
jgi:phage tail sheath protein FI